mmetsp:Transcript_19355/g.46762  ORF Transcript_19355/g.46762 Transcript_19355/m.46762 type:complete len:225 (+) Transcript_19355:9803-10477(+)
MQLQQAPLVLHPHLEILGRHELLRHRAPLLRGCRDLIDALRHHRERLQALLHKLVQRFDVGVARIAERPPKGLVKLPELLLGRALHASCVHRDAVHLLFALELIDVPRARLEQSQVVLPVLHLLQVLLHERPYVVQGPQRDPLLKLVPNFRQLPEQFLGLREDDDKGLGVAVNDLLEKLLRVAPLPRDPRELGREHDERLQLFVVVLPHLFKRRVEAQLLVLED